MSRARQTPKKRETRVSQRKARMDRYLRFGLVILIVAVVGILAGGIYWVAVAQPNEPVAVVAGRKISTRDYQIMVRYNRLNLRSQVEAIRQQEASLDPNDENSAVVRQYLDQQLQSLESQALSLPNQTLEDMISAELIRQEAQRRGITVSQEELEQEVQNWFGYNPNPPPPTPTAEATPTAAATATAITSLTVEPSPAATALSATVEPLGTVLALDETPIVLGVTPIATATVGPTPTPMPTPTPLTREAYEELRRNYLAYIRQRTGMSEGAFLRTMEVRVLERKLQEALAAEVPTTAPQVHVRDISVATQEEADKVRQRLQAGEDFAALAKELSQSASKDQGGDVGWLSEWSTALTQPVLEQVLQMNQGERDVVASYDGFHIVEVLEKEVARPLDEATLAQRRNRALQTWLEQALQSDAVKRYWSSEKVPLDTGTAG
ncbi:MAG: peptidylprolyl isomerase [Anaerolineae bacterium]